MKGNNDAHPQLRLGAEEIGHVEGVTGVEARRRFVGQQEPRRARQPPRDQHPRPLPAGKGRHLPVCERFHPCSLDRALNRGAVGVALAPHAMMRQAPKPHQRADGDGPGDLRRLRKISHGLRPRFAGEVKDRATVQPRLA